MAWPGYIWMESIFIFCAALAAADTLRIAAWLSHRIFSTAIPGYLNAAITCELAPPEVTIIDIISAPPWPSSFVASG